LVEQSRQRVGIVWLLDRMDCEQIEIGLRDPDGDDLHFAQARDRAQ
jgi:hypothetical protein